MKKRLVGSLAGSFLMFLLIGAAYSENTTNLDVAKMLVPQLNLDSNLPQNYTSMPAEKQFEIASGILADAGITVFVDKSYDADVSAGEAAGIVKALSSGREVKAQKLNRIAEKSALQSIEPDKALSVEEGQRLIDSIKTVDAGYAPKAVLNSAVTSQQLVVTQLVPGPGVSQQDIDLGIKTELIKVEPDITAPYTRKASPTL